MAKGGIEPPTRGFSIQDNVIFFSWPLRRNVTAFGDFTPFTFGLTEPVTEPSAYESKIREQLMQLAGEQIRKLAIPQGVSREIRHLKIHTDPITAPKAESDVPVWLRSDLDGTQAKVQPLTPPHRILRNEADLDAWIVEIRQTIVTKLKDGHIQI